MTGAWSAGPPYSRPAVWLAGLLAVWLWLPGFEVRAASRPVPIKVAVAGVRSVALERLPGQEYVYEVEFEDGSRARLSPGDFSRLLHTHATARPIWQRLLNVTSPVGIAWVALGLLGQAAFMARMLFQWLTSEREQRSVVPVAFWWLSLVGASMLLVYFVWRKDVVGILGQAAGFFIYVRNLWLIRRTTEQAHAAASTPDGRAG